MLNRLEPHGRVPADFHKELGEAAEFRKTMVADVYNDMGLIPFVPLDDDKNNLLDAMLLCGEHTLRRVPVVHGPSGDLINIITQSALVQTLCTNLDLLESVGKKTLRELNLALPGRVLSVTDKDQLRAAFYKIKEYNVSGVPVLDSENGQIVGNISARDVRLVALAKEVYRLLNMPISVYLDVVNNGAVNSAITCTPDDTIEEVIKRLVRSRIHRIYVVDSTMHVIRVISLRDVIRKFVKEPPGYFGHFFD